MSRSSAPSSCHHRRSRAQRVSPHLPLPVPDLSWTVLDTATGLTNFHFPIAINRVSLGFSSFIISKRNFWVLPAKAGEPLSLFLAPNWPQTQLEFNSFSCLFFAFQIEQDQRRREHHLLLLPIFDPDIPQFYRRHPRVTVPYLDGHAPA